MKGFKRSSIVLAVLMVFCGLSLIGCGGSSNMPIDGTIVPIEIDSNDILTSKSPAAYLSTATPLARSVIRGTCDVTSLKFIITANLDYDLMISAIPVSCSAGTSIDVGNVKMYDRDFQIGCSQNFSPQENEANFWGLNLVIPKGETREITVRNDIRIASYTGHQVKLSVDPSKIIAIAVDSGSSVTIDGNVIIGNPLTIVKSGSLYCGASYEEYYIYDVFHGLDYDLYYHDTVVNFDPLVMETDIEDLLIDKIELEVTTNFDSIKVNWVEISDTEGNGGYCYINNDGKGTMALGAGLEFEIEKAAKKTANVKANVTVYNNNVLPEIKIGIKITNIKATGKISCRIISVEDNTAFGLPVTTTRTGYLDRDTIKITHGLDLDNDFLTAGYNRFGPINFFSIARDFRISKMTIEAKTSHPDVNISAIKVRNKYLGSTILDAVSVVDGKVKWSLEESGPAFIAQHILSTDIEALIISDTITSENISVMLSITELEITDIESKEVMHVDNLPLILIKTGLF